MLDVFSLFALFTVQDRQSERHKDSRLNLRPPSHSATYATVSAWHHQPEKLILDSCGYEATVSHFLLSAMHCFVLPTVYHKIDWWRYFIWFPASLSAPCSWQEACQHPCLNYILNESNAAVFWFFLLVPRINDNQGSTRDWVHTRCLC